MPSRPGRACARCGAVVPAGMACPACRAVVMRASDGERAHAAGRGYGKAHRGFRLAVLARDSICVVCGHRAATVADHYPRTKRELQDAGADDNDPACGRGLCAWCHNRVTQLDERTRGGWNKR